MISDVNTKSKSIFFIITFIGSILFIILTISAMFFYPGGSYIDPSSSKYYFHLNYISDIGRTVAMNGIESQISPILFAIATTINGLCGIGYFYGTNSFFKSTPVDKKISKIVLSLTYVEAILFVSVGFIPCDVYPTGHLLVVTSAFFLLTIAMLLQTILIFRHKSYPKYYAVIFIVSLITIALYILLIYIYNNIYTLRELMIKVIAQKIAIYLLMVVMIIQSMGAISLEKKR
jgi:hypothetical protein